MTADAQPPQSPDDSPQGTASGSAAEPARESAPEPAPASGPADSAFSRAASGVYAREDGSLDVMQSLGGLRGLLEASLPTAAFLVVFVITQQILPAAVVAVGIGGVFAVLRLVQRGPLVQSLSGLAAIVLCAVVAGQTGQARDFYLWGFVTNAAYIVAFVLSILARWPLIGLLFGLVRGEGVTWRQEPLRVRRYGLATWIVTAVLAARLAVQVPLYLADALVALGTARLVMGLPLYGLALWVAWMITRPEALGDPGAQDAARQDVLDGEAAATDRRDGLS